MESKIKLRQEKLDLLSKAIDIPRFNRKGLQSGIVHIGVGGFHRAHQACYTDELISKHDVNEWGICGLGIREEDRAMCQALSEQDYLYTVVEKSPDGDSKPRVVGSITNFILAMDNPEKAIHQMAATTTKIVSLTITEGGYNLSDSTGEFDFSNPDIQWDLQHPDQPKTVFGYLATALGKRKAAGLPAFTILSCDNIQANGDMARRMLLTFIKELDGDLAGWVEENVSFPNSMVDRITPATTSEDIEELKEVHQIDDNWPVVCESFKQWIVEDCFVNGRPRWEEVGVQFVADVEPYEMMKLRLLNAGHSLLGIIGTLFGHSTIGEAVSDPLLKKMLCVFWDKEVTPTLKPVNGIDLEGYKASLLERFANPNIQDKLFRICSESSAKLPKFLLPTIKTQIEQGGPLSKGTAVVAAWFRYLELDGKLGSGSSYQIEDAMYDLLQGKVQDDGTENPIALLQVEDIFGDLGSSKRFAKLYVAMVRDLRTHGARQLIKNLVNNA